ncbi:sugar transferase [Actinopolymorpha singaporensis]|uniref:Sugar transferase involved in LPS biosynthesis (Colanic, teichoic acid) n=1 Tax=Actinopolymorpha singaporensis TaxID=117157 RepID=A0A1H1UPR4_9ACTN|nr:sugar transferase [Actinopolymorpha singaporensis]SDS74485.1 Sugar transferase involved in LPS biosynthesis (colanic, teichoic acid) [Actinopolymorpha singaporensis]
MAEESMPNAGVGENGAVVGARWVMGFHGAVGGSTFEAGQFASLREVALSRRSMGFGRIDVLTELPGRSGWVTPTSGSGAVHAGSGRSRVGDELGPLVSGQAYREAPRAAEETIPSRSSGESLAAYLDRRLADAPYVYLPNRGRAYAISKRLIDLVGAAILLLVSAPIMIALAILIRLDSPGPAIFRQTRVTRGGRVFTFFKFRTMYVDARERFPELYRYHLSEDRRDNTYYKLADDPRNTRVGRWLRRTTLDELPNLFNVLRGEMSLVGPRPDLPELVVFYRPEELACLFTKAGLTGLAQVAGRSFLTIRERLTLDMRYVAQQTLMLDLRILWRTVIVVLLGRGAF